MCPPLHGVGCVGSMDLWSQRKEQCLMAPAFGGPFCSRGLQCSLQRRGWNFPLQGAPELGCTWCQFRFMHVYWTPTTCMYLVLSRCWQAGGEEEPINSKMGRFTLQCNREKIAHPGLENHSSLPEELPPSAAI